MSRPRPPLTRLATWAVLACAGSLGACGLMPSGASAPPGQATDVAVALPAQFKSTDTRWSLVPPAEQQPRGDWWQAFGDPVLAALVLQADRQNARIEAAAARLAQARALLHGADAARSPQAGLNLGANRQGGPLVNAAGSNGTLGWISASLSYELDLFGRLAHASDAARLDAQAQQALLQSTRLLVHAEVAQGYLALRALDAEQKLLQATQASQQETLRLNQRRQRAGAVGAAVVEATLAELQSSEVEALRLARRRAELANALALLVGETASEFQLDPATWVARLPVIPPGIPSTLLARRADVTAAQQALLAAQARQAQARSAWFPSLSLTASGGHASSDLGQLLGSASRAWGLGALLALPLLDGGRREAGLAQADALRSQLLADYRGQILVAFKDVEDQLVALNSLADEADLQLRAVHAAGRSVALAESRFRNGLAPWLEVLEARRAELRVRRLALQVQAAQYQATVGLIRALGGGWEPAA